MRLTPNREMLVMADVAYAEAGLQTQLESIAKNHTTVLWFGEHTAGAEPDTFAHLQSIMGFEVWRALNGYWPSIDPTRSHTRLISGRHKTLVSRAQRLLRRYEDLRFLVERDPRGLNALHTDADRLDVARARQLHAFLSQPLPIAEVFTNAFGEFVPLDWALDGLEAVLDGKAGAVREADLKRIAGTYLIVRR